MAVFLLPLLSDCSVKNQSYCTVCPRSLSWCVYGFQVFFSRLSVVFWGRGSEKARQTLMAARQSLVTSSEKTLFGRRGVACTRAFLESPVPFQKTWRHVFLKTKTRDRCLLSAELLEIRPPQNVIRIICLYHGVNTRIPGDDKSIVSLPRCWILKTSIQKQML